jgi:uncharacterized membrane protein
MCSGWGKFPSRYRYDDEKTLRLITRTLTYNGLLDAAFNQIRQFGKSIPAVMIRLMEALILIHSFVKTQSQIQGIRKHARMILNICRKNFEEPNDLKDLNERGKAVFAERQGA